MSGSLEELLLPLKLNQQETGPGSGLRAEDLVRWVAALPGLEPVCFPATGRSWPVDAGSESAHVGGPVLGQALIALMDLARETATACRTRSHTVWEAALVWWARVMPWF